MKFFVTLEKFIAQLNLEILSVPDDINKIHITSTEVNRPGLLISGFSENFEPTRLQILGKMEFSYLDSLDQGVKMERINNLFSRGVPAVIITRNMLISTEIVECARKHKVPLLRTSEETSAFMAHAISYLNTELAQRVTRHGVLMEVYGEGILIVGDSGVGKSETAIELVKRGHRLIADDAVEIRKLSHTSLVGQSPENIQNFIELRGVGIINIARTYGASAVKQRQEIDMVIELENWKPDKSYSTTGLTDEYTDILGVSVVKSVIPVRPGRNISIVIETAAVVNRQKKMGYFAAKELLKQLGIEE
ncbi:MAG: HPr(Ser) kinase/phosphatase [Oscillospiraceae bacterium]|nr:HPr(Ser) kinase/phosphatase [Oscillospiraceae bacterium]MBQ6850988.1 HPr(Ser) kinase/phosphatase [Oscillospiraceae bacterium]MBR6610176.1 HPr(Ser) kinase/phosphatase [Oscillospiraceae bacterium]